jgi:hypothetical protein
MRVIKNMNNYKSWKDNGVSIQEESVQQLAEGLSHDALQMNTQTVKWSEAEHW